MSAVTVVADSINEFGNRITTMEVVFPRIILAEFNTHRMLSRNSASSRAIPYKKLLKSVIEDPFIPIAFQKDHSGMQGKEYLDMNVEYSFNDIVHAVHKLLMDNFKDEDGNWDESAREVEEALSLHVMPFMNDGTRKTIKNWWLKIRDLVVAASLLLHAMGVTKQICNRLLEVFIKNHKVLVTATEWENFFALRCSQYRFQVTNTEDRTNFKETIYRSKKDVLKDIPSLSVNGDEKMFWLLANKGQAEIHMMALAEAMWDAYNESTPRQLKAGEWHIPYRDKLDHDQLAALVHYNDFHDDLFAIKVSTVMAARTSYTVVGEDQKPLTYERMIEIHDELKAAWPKHMSPFEHCAQTMSRDEYLRMSIWHNEWQEYGVSGNFRGFIQYRKTIAGENITA